MILDFLTKLVFGPDGGLTYSKLHSMAQREHLSDYLPWIAFDDLQNVYINSDNTAGFIFECFPHCFTGEKTFETLEAILRLSLSDNSIVQFILYGDDNIEPFLEGFEKLKVRDEPVLKRAAKNYTDFLRSGAKGSARLAGIPIRNFRLFITVKMPFDKIKKEEISDLLTTTKEILHGAHLYPQIVKSDAFLLWMRGFFNEYTSDNDFLYNEEIPIRKQVIMAETDVHKSQSHICIGDKVFKCLTPKVMPGVTDFMQTGKLFGGIKGISSDIEQHKTPFLFTLNILFHNLKAALHTKCNLILQQKSFGSLSRTMGRKQEEFTWATDKLEKGEGFFRIVPVFWIWGKSESEALDSSARAKRIWEGQGYVMQEDRFILLPLFISSLPFGFYDVGKNVELLERDFIAPSDTITQLMPVQGDFAGSGSPVMLFTGRKGQLCQVDLFDQRAANYNLFVAAGSGSGKSFLLNSIIANYYGSGALVRVIDIGGSYKKQAKIFKGRYMDFGQEEICMNPFTSVNEPHFDLPTIARIVMQMIYSSSASSSVSETQQTIVNSAVRWAWEGFGHEADIDRVYEYLQGFPKHATELDFDCPDKKDCTADIVKQAHMLAYNLTDFTSSGAYGRYFNGQSSFDIAKDEYVVLELEHLKPQKSLFNVVLLQVINAVTHDLYLSDRKRARLILLDEAWQFLTDSSILKGVIEEGYRRARKYRGCFGVVTQSLMDLERFGDVGGVIKDNSAWKFYLQSDSFEQAHSHKIIDYDEFTLEMLKSVSTNRPLYSEIFMDTPFSAGVTRFSVDPYSYYLYTSDPKESAEIESFVQKGMSYEQAIDEMVKKYRS